MSTLLCVTRRLAILLMIAAVAGACGSGAETSPTDAEGPPPTSTTSTTELVDPPTTVAPADDAGAEPQDDYGTDPGDDGASSGGDASPGDGDAETLEIGSASEPGTLTPVGTYTLDLLGEDWRVTTSEPLFVEGSDQMIMVSRAEEWGTNSSNFMLLIRVVGIVPPREVGIHQEHDPVVPESTIEMPDSLDSWFEAVPQVQVLDSGSTTVAGEPATWWRLTVDPAAGDTFHCHLGDHCAGFVVNPGLGVFVLSPTRDFTVWQMEAIPDVIGFVEAVDGASGDIGRRAMASLLAGIAAA